jgi:hypothetical protein
MEKAVNFILTATIAFCSVLLLLSIYPGVLQSNVISLIWSLLGLLLIVFIFCCIIFYVAFLIVALVMKWRSPQTMTTPLYPSLSTTAKLRIGFILAVALGAFGLLKFYVPRRIAFQVSRPAFEQWLAQNPAKTTNINRQLGLYNVDHYAIDQRGGKYFRVHSHGDGLGPDTVSYGFVYQPNSEGSPFGAAHYSIHPLGNGWYWFESSSDW